MARIHILVDRDDKLRYETQAEREGKSLGAWLREAAEDKYRKSREGRPFRSRQDLADFFDRCDETEPGREPDWAQHREALERSRVAGVERT